MAKTIVRLATFCCKSHDLQIYKTAKCCKSLYLVLAAIRDMLSKCLKKRCETVHRRDAEDVSKLLQHGTAKKHPSENFPMGVSLCSFDFTVYRWVFIRSAIFQPSDSFRMSMNSLYFPGTAASSACVPCCMTSPSSITSI